MILNSLSNVQASAWNRLIPDNNPFLNHAFLHGLEQHDCVGEKWGWYPQHVAIVEDGEPVAAMPLYLKDNSYGELVFDWNWADAYQRAGIPYYPKLVSAIPYTPVTSSRLLVAPERPDAPALKQQLLKEALQLARERELSSLHILFPDQADMATLEHEGLLSRMATQFHWHNQAYTNFDDFLARFTAKRRKNLKRERRLVRDQGIEVEWLDGHNAGDEHWQVFHQCYLATFDKHWGYATLSLDFFRHLGQNLPEQVVLMLAKREGRYIAGALSLRSDNTLYGRHWGSLEEVDHLHFELCYYQGIEYCIQHGLQHFEPGAQGEHKVSRGFEPTTTWSGHWLAHSGFSQAIARHLAHEREAMQDYMMELRTHLPFHQSENP